MAIIFDSKWLTNATIKSIENWRWFYSGMTYDMSVWQKCLFHPLSSLTTGMISELNVWKEDDLRRIFVWKCRLSRMNRTIMFACDFENPVVSRAIFLATVFIFRVTSNEYSHSLGCKELIRRCINIGVILSNLDRWPLADDRFLWLFFVLCDSTISFYNSSRFTFNFIPVLFFCFDVSTLSQCYTLYGTASIAFNWRQNILARTLFWFKFEEKCIHLKTKIIQFLFSCSMHAGTHSINIGTNH